VFGDGILLGVRAIFLVKITWWLHNAPCPVIQPNHGYFGVSLMGIGKYLILIQTEGSISRWQNEEVSLDRKDELIPAS
jgi:hypothetical protein